ncbi:unnamed protein product [Spirodela intermedia]|uniref:Homeobox domain-containing protein n=1 Tax=Spirodela intermedia TaxID=51605 RepID=A0A7I8IF51_SPIIN|nr:unnamed protein product [Spirodela intermedia]CAA6656416.1 unnamed protein product [Spirodela intermedia]
MNCEPPPAEAEEEIAGGASPQSIVSSVVIGDNRKSENGTDSPGEGIISDEEDGNEGTRKKLRLSKEQSAVLEETFRVHQALSPMHKAALAKRLSLRPRQVEVWFQNRRARTKLKQTELACDFLKRRCEKLTEENQRLLREVQQLRLFMSSPTQLYMGMAAPPTTLTDDQDCSFPLGAG